MSKIKVFGKKPYEDWEYLTIENSLEALQEYVKGYIETVTLFKDACIVCNDMGRVRGLPYNCRICDVDFVGNILLVGTNDEDFCDVPGTLKDWEEML